MNHNPPKQSGRRGKAQRTPAADSPKDSNADWQSLRRHKLPFSDSDLGKLQQFVSTLQISAKGSSEWKTAYVEMVEKGWYLELAGSQAEFDEILTHVFTSAKTDLPVQATTQSPPQSEAQEAVRNESGLILPGRWSENQIIGATNVLPVEIAEQGPIGFWHVPATITANNFRYKSLSNFAFNIAVGCGHACIFCYVPDASTRKLGHALAGHGVTDPDAQWGEYVLIRPWDEKKFLDSLREAELIPQSQLKPDGNRAIIFCSTTDAYQVIRHPDPARQKELNDALTFMIRRALELIRDNSTLNVRILTRGPLARRDFDLYKTFGNRLAFGMSLPTLDNRLARIYEPHAPAPSQRLATLQAAKAAGLHVFVAVAPTYPECDEADLRRTLAAIKPLDPITIFHEPINIRAENVGRIEEHGRNLGVTLNTKVFATRPAWRNYALGSLMTVERLARAMGLINRLHLWPDNDLGSKPGFLEMRRQAWDNEKFTRNEIKEFKKDDELAYQQLRDWLAGWWSRISEWPGN